MTNLTKKLVTATATVAVLANAAMPLAFADTTITVTGNGENSQNAAVVSNSSTTSVSQSNTANFTNNVSGSANTGNNNANSNTGGNVSVTTGAASVSNTVSNQANQNSANVGCNCANGDTLVKIAGNGEDSKNSVTLGSGNATNLSQYNNANFDNNLSGNANSGKNLANGNTGGNVDITTGSASVSNSASNWANGNSATVGGNGGNGGSVNLLISGNGHNSSNAIVVGASDSVVLSQSNTADFDNDLGGSANTGNNNANSNTGGNVSITTGDASVDNSVDNMANFNSADLDCGCAVGDLSVTISGNGEDSHNSVVGSFGSTQTLAQANVANFDNMLDCLWANTGNNVANGNTGAVNGWSDPSITTGDASTSSDVSNTANLNGAGGDMPSWPTWDFGGIHLSLSFDLQALLAALG